ncbi:MULTISPECIES: XrtB/PEP-CTERM-associated transcriptional regulator EpsA [Methylotenera]|uniref:XrtB/PEP-CTERM-associated transcriptional regulator EpsA n=1 Tax=Methylotenera TaxID=359407 RepID=UPI00037BC0FA|nr:MULTISPECIES: XrtB/PEP-CTERM-associated transcriptional regulator EpsA [Methylotenera]
MIISTQFTIDEPVKADICLDDEQRVVFMEVIEESLRVSQRTHLFNWLQAGFQYLLPHEVMIYGVKSTETDEYDFGYFTSSRYFDENRFNEVIDRENGLVTQALKVWQRTALPVFVTNHLPASDYGNYSVLNIAQSELKASELGDFVAHGFGDNHTRISTFVIFARLSKQLNNNHARILELIMPHLHCGLIRVTSNRTNLIHTNKVSKKITGRESEILQWVHMGKTNWEISSILSISPLTVKNHVQNILRKLDVQNRSQAAVKAAKLGLVKVLK